MAGLVESFIFKMVVENGQFNRALAESTQQVQKTGKAFQETQGILSQTSSAFLGVGITQASLSFVKGAVQAQAALVNVKSTAEQVFGEGTDQIKEWAKGSVEAFGLSERAFIQGATTIAALGKAAGLTGQDLAGFSKQMIQYATDLSQMYNTSVEDAIAAIQSGFSGSSIEPLRRYNIILNDTILKQEYFRITGENVTGVLSTQQRMVAFLSAFQKQAADSTGQWNREYDGLLATQQRFGAELENVKAKIGESLIGPATSAISVLETLAKGFITLDTASGGLVGRLAGLGVVAAGLWPALRGTALSITRMRAAQKGLELDTAAVTSGLNAMRGGLAALVIGVGLYEQAMANRAQNAAAVTSEFGKMLGSTNEELIGFIDTANELANKKDFWTSTPFEQGYTVTADLKKSFEELAAQSYESAAAMRDQILASEDVKSAYDEAGLSAEDMNRILDEAKKKNDAAATATDKYRLAVDKQAESLPRNEKAWDDFAKAVDKVQKNAKDATDQLEKLLELATDQFTADLDPLIARQQLIADIAEAEVKAQAVKDAKDPAEKAKAELDVLENKKAVLEDIIAIRDADVAAIEDANGKALTGKELYEAQLAALQKLKIERPDLAGIIDQAIAELQQQQPSIDVALKAIDDGTFQSQVQQAVLANGGAEVAVDLLIDSGMAESDARKVIDQLPDEKVVQLVTQGAKIADQLGLDDEGRMKVTAKLVVDEAKREMESLTREDYYQTIIADPDFALADRAIDAWLREKRFVYIDTVWKLPTESSPTSPTPGDYSRSAVRAGQPVQTVVNIQTAPGSPQEVVAAVQTWARRNGAVVSPVR